MFLWWGPQLICFYNDAYRPSLGENGKHPGILGQGAREAWPEIWDIIHPLINQILAGGEGTWMEDQLIPIYRNGKIEDVYWTFSYSPVNDESGNVAGVLVTCSETTHKVGLVKVLQESNRRYLNQMLQAPVAMCIFRGREHVVEIANELMLELWGKTKEQVINKPIFEGLPEVKGQGFEQLLDHVFNTGEKFVAYERLVNLPRNGTIENTYINFVYDAFKEPDGTISGIVAIASDITVQVLERKKIEESEERFRTMAEGSAVLIAISNESGITAYFNNAWVELTGRSMEDLLKLDWSDLLHREDSDAFTIVYQTSLQKKQSFAAEFRVLNKQGEYRWLWMQGMSRLRPDGSFGGHISSGIDITDRKEAAEKIRRFEFMVDNASDLFVLMCEDGSFDYLNKVALERWGYTAEEAKHIRVPDIDPLYDDEKFRALFAKAQKKNVPLFETRHRNKNGDVYPVEVNVGGLNLDGKPYLFAVVRDITDRKKAENILKETKEQLELTFANVPAALSLFDKKGDIIFANDKAARLAGHNTAEELLQGRNYSSMVKSSLETMEILNENGTQLLPELFPTQLALKTGKTSEALLQLINKQEKSRIWLLIKSAPILDAAGQVQMVLTTNTDITIQKTAEEKIRETEQRFRIVADSAPVLIWMAAPDKLRSFFNKAWLHFTGRAMEQETGNGWIGGLHPEDIKRCLDVYVEAFDRRGEFYIEYRIKRYDGEYRWLSDKGVPRFASDGAFEGYIGACMDIHERTIYQKKLKEDEERLNIIIKASELGTWDLNMKTDEMICSPRYLEIFGYKENDHVTHSHFLDLIHPDDLEVRNNALKEAIATSVLQYESRVIWDDQTIHWIEAKGRIFYDDLNRPLKLIGTVRDITEQKTFASQLEKQVQERTAELEQKNRELESMNSELQSFAYVSSHDLQEPLRKIQTFATRILLKELETLSDTGKDYFHRMQEAAKRMQTLIEDLLSYSRTNTTERIFENTNLNEILEQVKTELKEDILEKHAIIETGQLCEAHIIPFQFRQLVHNLIGNSLKFSKPGRAPHIKVVSEIVEGTELNIPQLAPQHQYCHLSIADNGIGFEQQYRERIFEVFQRLHGKDEHKGTGIGLAIVKKIVENHNGIIVATGELNKGATFDIYLPAIKHLF